MTYRKEAVLPSFPQTKAPGSDVRRQELISSSISTALFDSGIRCALPAFIRSAGIDHALASKSNSDHVAPRTSPKRADVSIRKSIASSTVSLAFNLIAMLAIKSVTSRQGNAAKCSLTLDCFGRPREMDRSGASASRHPFECAKSRTVPIRWRTRRAVSGRVSQISARTSRTIGPSI